MVIFGNICLALMALGFAFLLGLLAERGSGPSRGDGGGPGSFMLFFLAPAMFLAFSATYCAVVAGGKLDWLGLPRGLQYLAVVLTCLCLTILMAGAFVMSGEPASQVPAGLRPFGLWASWAVPLLLILIALAWINPSLGAPVFLLRGAFAALAITGLAVGAVLLGEGIMAMQTRQVAQVQVVQNRESSRDRMILEQTEKADPVKDFGSLLSQTNKWEPESIHNLALSKVLSTGDQFPALLADAAGHYYFYHSVLVFLRDNDPPDPAGLGHSIQLAIQTNAQHVRETIEGQSTIRPDEFDSDTETVLAVADKYARYGVDCVPAVQEFRAALATPRPAEQSPMGNWKHCRKSVDEWLAKHARR